MRKIFTIAVLLTSLINLQNVNGKQCRSGVSLENMYFSFWISHNLSYDTLCIPGTAINFHANIHISDGGICECFVSATNWYHNGLLVSSADSCMVTDTGSYQMQSGIDDCGVITYTFNLHVGYSAATGISETNLTHVFALYPSVSTGVFQIKTSGERPEKILISNSTGEIILVSEINLSEINLSHFSPGIYFYAITDEKQNVWRGKLLKN